MSGGAIPPSISVRQATAHDAAAIAALNGQLGYSTSARVAQSRLNECITGSDRSVIVALDGDRVVAWVEIQRRTALESGAWAEITGLIVDAQYRGRGVGTSLVDRAQSWARERSLTRLRVRTNALRADAHTFYETRGFTLTKQQRVYDVTL